MSVLGTSVIGAALETTPGVFVNPNLATDAILAFGYEVTPMESEEVRREIERPFPGVNPATYTAIRARHRFSVELTGAGTSVVTPAWYRTLFRACLMDAHTVQAGVSVTYPLGSTGDGASISLVGFKGNARHRARMVRGNCSFEFVEKQLPRMTFDLVGLIEGTSPMDNAASGSVVLPTYPQPQEVNLANTVITLGGFTLGVRSLIIDLGMKTEFFSTTGQRAIIFGKDQDGDRRAVTGQLVAELPDPATRNFFTDVIPRTPLAFSLVHGTQANNIVDISSARAVLGRITYSVEQNRVFMNAPITFEPSAAGNELSIKTR
jgi:hypothetical protein